MINFYQVRNSFSLIFMCLLFTGCVKNNEKPLWLRINSFSLLANPLLANDEGALSHNFNNGTVRVDGKLIGVFELPITLPLLLAEGPHQITVSPTIERNGINATKESYPFVLEYNVTTNFLKSDTVQVFPTTKYLDNSVFWIEDFEDATINIIGLPANGLQTSADPLFLKYGSFFGKIELNGSQASWSGVTVDADKGDGNPGLPKAGAEIYLEIDYYNTAGLSTDIISYTNGTPVYNPTIRLNAQTNPVWKKIYIEMKEVVSSNLTADRFQIGLKAAIDAAIGNSFVYIDNIKIVHLQ